MTKQVYMPDQLKDSSDLGYSHAIVQNGVLYMSGQVALDADNDIVGDDLKTQSQKAFENVEILLNEAGYEIDDVVKVKSHIVKPQGRLDEFIDVWMDIFDEPFPCHTILGVDQLAVDGLLVELEVEVPVQE